MQRLLLSIATLVLGFAAPRAAAAGAPDAEILGEWRGTSKCVDLTAAPNCQDEVVLYQFLPVTGAADRVLLKAYKIVNNVPDLMGELEFHHRADAGVWENEFKSPRFHGLWSFTIKERRLSGTLVTLPDRKVVRQVDTTKR